VAGLLAYGLQVKNGQCKVLSAAVNYILCTHPKSVLHEANDWKQKQPSNNFMCFIGCVLLGLASECVGQLFLNLYVSLCSTIFAKLPDSFSPSSSAHKLTS